MTKQVSATMGNNPEKIMLFLFPVITLGVLLALVVGAWCLGQFVPGLYPPPV
ncbi:MAG: hypothetical protein SFZ03_05285 [Candidatus Melainabacteria bacterium]|nr:hypothetical protein [Candidatus Melainabacteria bacterium]